VTMSSRSHKLSGLYVITDHLLSRQGNLSLTGMVEAALEGGARLVQYRSKSSSALQRHREAESLLAMCRSHDALLIINDDVSLAKAVAADGVHLGQGDSSLAQARAILGEDFLIGITCHDRIELALAAQAGGADYVAFGRFFPSRSKPEAPGAPLSVLEQAHANLRIPIAAIGGITPANAGSLLQRGADMLAVIHGVFGAEDIAAAARDYCRTITLQSRHASNPGH
jgi:thiamine-phosphate pyrophosphorylase